MKKKLRDVIEHLAKANIQHIAYMSGKTIPQFHPEESVFTMENAPIVSATIMTVCTIYGITGEVDLEQEIDWFGKELG